MPVPARRASPVIALFLLLAACGHNVRSFVEPPFPEKLSAWRLFRRAGGRLVPNDRVVPYDLINPLFTDYASKHRFVWMPPGKPALYSPDDTFRFPVGAVLAKTFSYPGVSAGSPERLVETRLLVNTPSGWVALPYVWDVAGDDATLQLVADPVDVSFRAPSGATQTIRYVIPNANDCRECHDQNKLTGPIGPKARHLNRDLDYSDGRFNQLAYWTRIGYLSGAPAPSAAPKQPLWTDPSVPLGARARAYLDINCAHCHSPAGAAGNTGLYLSDLQPDLARIGVCKTPVATGKASAGMLFDIVPGRPADSILLFRMDSAEPKVMMPEIGRTIVHREGVELVRRWLASLQGGCGTPHAEI